MGGADGQAEWHDEDSGLPGCCVSDAIWAAAERIVVFDTVEQHKQVDGAVVCALRLRGWMTMAANGGASINGLCKPARMISSWALPWLEESRGGNGDGRVDADAEVHVTFLPYAQRGTLTDAVVAAPADCEWWTGAGHDSGGQRWAAVGLWAMETASHLHHASLWAAASAGRHLWDALAHPRSLCVCRRSTPSADRL